jgi:hypothetical protein
MCLQKVHRTGVFGVSRWRSLAQLTAIQKRENLCKNRGFDARWRSMAVPDIDRHKLEAAGIESALAIA